MDTNGLLSLCHANLEVTYDRDHGRFHLRQAKAPAHAHSGSLAEWHKMRFMTVSAFVGHKTFGIELCRVAEVIWITEMKRYSWYLRRILSVHFIRPYQ